MKKILLWNPQKQKGSASLLPTRERLQHPTTTDEQLTQCEYAYHWPASTPKQKNEIISGRKNCIILWVKNVNATQQTLIMAQNTFCQNMHPFKCHKAKFYL